MLGYGVIDNTRSVKSYLNAKKRLLFNWLNQQVKEEVPYLMLSIMVYLKHFRYSNLQQRLVYSIVICCDEPNALIGHYGSDEEYGR